MIAVIGVPISPTLAVDRSLNLYLTVTSYPPERA